MIRRPATCHVVAEVVRRVGGVAAGGVEDLEKVVDVLGGGEADQVVGLGDGDAHMLSDGVLVCDTPPLFGLVADFSDEFSAKHETRKSSVDAGRRATSWPFWMKNASGSGRRLVQSRAVARVSRCLTSGDRRQERPGGLSKSRCGSRRGCRSRRLVWTDGGRRKDLDRY